MAIKNFPRFFALILLIGIPLSVIPVFSFPAHAAEPDFLSPAERQWLREHDGTIRVAPDPYYPPVEFIQDDRYIGIALDYLKLIEKKLHIRFQIVRLDSFEEILEKAETREIDLVSTIMQTPDRARYLLFTPPYITIPNVLVTRNENQAHIEIKDLEDITGVVYQGGYTIGAILKEHGILHARPVTDPASALKDLSKGRVNVMVGNLAVISHYVSRMNLANLRVAGYCEFEDAISFASRSDWPILNRIMEKTLGEISPEERTRIENKWIRLESPGFHLDRRFWFGFFGVLGVFLSLVAFFYAVNRALKKQVAAKTLTLQQSEEALRRSEEKYRLLVENANEIILVAQDGRLVFVNIRAVKFSGYPETELLNRPFVEFIHPDDRQMVAQYHKQRSEGSAPRARYTFRFIRIDGCERWMEISSVRIDWENRPATLNFLSDVTDRKLTEAALKKSERQYRLIAENTADVIIVLDLALRFTYVSPSIERLRGFTVEESMKQSLDQILTPESKRIALEAFAAEQALEVAGTADPNRSRILELEEYRKDGSTIWAEMVLSFLRDREGKPNGILTIARDITERKRAEAERESLESQFRQAQKMEAVGQLAGGVAHDFNNMLSIINGYAELALESLDASDPLHDNLREIMNAGLRSADLVRQLLAFARKQTICPIQMDLNETVSSMLKMLKRLIGEDIELIWEPAADLWPVKMDPSQLDQILANLMVNARDAVSGIGRIVIKTDKIVFEKTDRTRPPGLTPGEFVMLSVSDNGCGMEKKTLNRLFEPFFTTKPQGQGTGLGLATVYGIVKQNNGYIYADSEPGNGTTFRLYLPRREDGEIRADQEASGYSKMAAGTETVLVVEDNAELLELTEKLLKRLGYNVLAAGNPNEAIRLATDYTGEIQLLLTDVIMPEMNGRDLREVLAPLRPEMKVLFMSGYTANAIAHHGVLGDGICFLQKPFTRDELAGKLREALSCPTKQRLEGI